MKTLKFKPYFFEPLRSMKKMSTIRKSDKGLKKGDLVECWFEGTGFCLLRVVRRVEQVKFKDLKHNHAWFEGYRHVDLLKHELKSIYPDICGGTDPARLSNITLAEFNALKNYEIFCVLRMEDDVDYCRLLLKKGGY